MLQRLKVPHTLQWVIRLFLLYMVIFTLFRISSYLLFNPDKYIEHGEGPSQYTTVKVLPAFLLGVLYDARWISIVLAPIVIASCIPQLSPFRNNVTKRVWSFYLIIITFLMLFFFGADFGHFEYVRTRLNASALNFFEDAKISLRMLWESYPILWIFLGLAVVIIFLTFIINRTYFRVEERNIHKSKYDYHRRWYLVTLLLMSFFIYGGFRKSPLKTSDSFRNMNDEFRGFLALNPFQNFFTSLKFRNPSFEGNKVDEAKRSLHYSQIANLLQLDYRLARDTAYTRNINYSAVTNQPNVVLVVCESLSAYKTSMSGNVLKSTPYLNSLSDSSVYFDRCFTPTFGTARGLFALLTGIPDVQLSKFSSRNQNAINQHTIINNFTDYEKLYFIGGSTEFNNFKGLIKNINNVKLFEEGSYKAKHHNVWGISDKNLMLEANTVFKQQTKPFFAVIQTADNHEPYDIPQEDDAHFGKESIEKEQLKANGFKSIKEYNAVKYFDYCVQQFIEKAKQEAYFNNTIFVFIGDHGVIGDARTLYPSVWTSHRLTEEHVPLLFYAPKLLPAQRRKEVVSQIDVLPTIAGITKQSYTNTTLGRDVLDSNKKGNYAFTIFHDAGKIGIVSDSFYYVHNYNTDDHELLPLINNLPIAEDYKAQKIKQYFALAEGMYETSKWMLIHNKKKIK
jgi:phosphoglycerol transferase MdoB-like AlkP superfamily enzyme